MRLAIAVMLAIVPAFGIVSAKEIDYSAYPDVVQDKALPQIVLALRDAAIDPISITNFKICFPPFKAKVENGQLVQWSLMFSMNAKNRYGGYAGTQGWIAVFYSHKPVWVFSTDTPLTPTQAATCSRVPDAEIQRLLAN